MATTIERACIGQSGRCYSLLVAILMNVYHVHQSVDELADMGTDEFEAFVETMRVYKHLPKN